jgi:hypothetical protein
MALLNDLENLSVLSYDEIVEGINNFKHTMKTYLDETQDIVDLLLFLSDSIGMSIPVFSDEEKVKMFTLGFAYSTANIALSILAKNSAITFEEHCNLADLVFDYRSEFAELVSTKIIEAFERKCEENKNKVA